MSLKNETRRVKHQILEQLTALRDEGKVQLHLLSLDARHRWNELEKQIEKLESEADREGAKAGELLRHSAQQLTQSLNDFMSKHLNHSLGLRTSVRTLMATHVRVCHPEDSLTEAAQLMWNGDWGAIPVVADGKAIGMISDRDVCMATFTQGKAPSELRVEGAMSKELYSCAPDDSIADALAMMAKQRVRRLPVLSPEGKVVGIVSLADVLHWAKPQANPALDAAVIEALSAISAHVPQKLHAAAE
jgi:CBS domain-containing protein